jgi:hypothetical protein
MFTAKSVTPKALDIAVAGGVIISGVPVVGTVNYTSRDSKASEAGKENFA